MKGNIFIVCLDSQVDFPKVVQDKLKMIEHQDILSAVGEVKSSDQKANEACK